MGIIIGILSIISVLFGIYTIYKMLKYKGNKSKPKAPVTYHINLWLCTFMMILLMVSLVIISSVNTILSAEFSGGYSIDTIDLLLYDILEVLLAGWAFVKIFTLSFSSVIVSLNICINTFILKCIKNNYKVNIIYIVLVVGINGMSLFNIIEGLVGIAQIVV